jgi:hypothetical protein
MIIDHITDKGALSGLRVATNMALTIHSLTMLGGKQHHLPYTESPSNRCRSKKLDESIICVGTCNL